jgi:VWFA-related protein
MSKKILSALLALLIAAPAALPQQTGTPAAPPAAPPANQDDETIRVGSTAVQVDVIVTDKAGRRVTGLAADDFQVLDEGKPVALDFFAAVEGSRLSRAESRAGGTVKPAAPEAVGQSALLRPYPGRHLALVVDDTTMTNENFLRTRTALADYVNGKLTPSDMAAIISLGGRLGTSQQFTNDKQRLLAAINRLAAGSNRHQQVRDQFNLTYAEAVRINAGDNSVLTAVARRASATSLANQGTSGTIADQSRVGGGGIAPRGAAGEPNEEGGMGASDESILRARIKTAAQSRIGELASDARNTIVALSSLFKSMADLPGRKVVLLLSESFITLGGSSEDQTNQLVQLIELARRSGISVYALDAGGLRTTSAQASEQLTGIDIRSSDLAGFSTTFGDSENMSAARMVAFGTGGTVIQNTNDIVGGLGRAVEDSGSYYVVGFQPPALDNKFHRLAVTVKGKPDLVVRTRRGYLAVNQETVRGTGAELAAAMLSPVPYIDLPLDVVARVVPQAGEQTVQLGFHVGRNYLALPAADAADKTASYELVAAVFAAGKDDPVGGIKRTLVFDTAKPEEKQRLTSAGLVFVPQPLSLPPGHYQLRAVMREKTSGAVGSAYQFFEVPNTADRKAVSMSSVMLNEAGKTEFSGTHTFKRTAGDVDVHYFIYNLPKDTAQLTQQVRLLDSQGRVLMDSPLPLSAAETSPGLSHQGTRIKLPPTRGRYALIVRLSDKKGKVDVERRADFVVE